MNFYFNLFGLVIWDILKDIKQGKSAACFCHQVAAWVPDMFSNFYFMKNHNIAKTKQPLKLEKNKHSFGILGILEFFDIYLTNVKINQILLNKIRNRFLLTTKLFTG
jgi:hypothetical protein